LLDFETAHTSQYQTQVSILDSLLVFHYI